MSTRTFLSFALIALLLSACGGASEPTLDPNAIMTVAFATVNASGTQTAIAIPTNTATATVPPTNTPMPEPTAYEPTVILSASVNTAVAYCRFGPDTVYVARFGLRFGVALEAIGRTQAGDWVLIRNTGGERSCWVSTSLISVSGDVFTLGVAPVVWVPTDKYLPPSEVSATRSGEQVVVTWSAVTTEPRDTYYEAPYLLEVWVCNTGQLVHQFIGAKELTAALTDQPGCAEASHGLLYSATREGYSQPAAIPWPLP